jgi:hypothetical protein
MIDLRYKPMWLPQVNAPFNYTLNMLDKEGVDYKYLQIDPDELIPSQGIVAQDKVSQIDMDNIQPIWISKEMKVLDGHHRYVAALSRAVPIKALQIMLSQKDAIRTLNKIQDIFEYENQESIMEVVAQDQINGMNDINSAGTDGSTFLEALSSELEDDDREILHDTKSSGKKPKKITGYRKQEVNEKSVVGNFFSLKPVDGYNKYEMEFDNILNTNDLDLTFRGDVNPVSLLANNWFPNIDFDKISKNHNVSSDSIINRAVAEKAKQMGYDGIKYGDIMVQGLN